MPKAITPVISVILLLLITISMVGFAMVFFTRIMETASQEGEQQLSRQMQTFGESFEVISIDGNKVYVRNRGTSELKNLAFFVDNNPVTAAGSPIPEDGVGTFTLDAGQLAQYPGKKLKVTSSGTSREEDANFYAKNTVAYWTFDGTDGRTIKDESGSGNDGTFSGEAWNDGTLKPSCPNCPQQTAGKYGSALQFDGVNDYVSVADADSLDLSQNNAATIGAWVKPTLLTGYYVINKRTGEKGYGIYIYADGSVIGGFGDTSYTGPVTPAGVVVAGVWTHIVARYDGATRKVFVNGVEKASENYILGIGASTSTLNIGSEAGGGSGWFNGVIDEVRIWNRALSQQEILNDMNSAYPINRPVASYSFEKIVDNKAWDTHNVVKGQYGAALSFDGTNDEIQISDAASLDITGDITVSSWVMQNVVAYGRGIVEKYAGSPRSGFRMTTTSSGRFDWVLADGAGAINTATSTTEMVAGTWYFLMGVKDATNMRLYVNAFREDSAGTITQGANNVNVHIGGTEPGVSAFFNGAIDEVRILNVARS